jgi:hypothetical protein
VAARRQRLLQLSLETIRMGQPVARGERISQHQQPWRRGMRRHRNG